MKNEIDFAVELLKNAKHIVAFTGAGISVESGIPPFRGENGLWNKYDPDCLLLDRYLTKPAESWKVIKEIFFNYFGVAQPNKAHQVLARMESEGNLKAIITMNIDNLHQEAGSKKVIEYHGNTKHMVCTHCHSRFSVLEVNMNEKYPQCPKCNHLLKPDFIFFGEAIPTDAYQHSFEEAQLADVLIIVGTTGEVMPASQIPNIAKRSGAKIIEINTAHTPYSDHISDIFLKGKAGKIFENLESKLF